jgi:hypothetical protein
MPSVGYRRRFVIPVHKEMMILDSLEERPSSSITCMTSVIPAHNQSLRNPS